MKKEEIHLWDIERILFGQAPPQFLLEVFIRTLVIYIAAIFVMRWMGKRMNGQLTIIELAVMVMMGAIISVPMQVPDKGILQGLLVLFTTLFFLRMINWASYKNAKFETLVQGKVSTLVIDGVLQLEALQENHMSNQQVYMVLRNKNIFNLGKVKRLYMEACGIFSVYQEENEKAGLPIYPPIDELIYTTHPQADDGQKACCKCGFVQQKQVERCPNCGNGEWAMAII